MEKIIIAAIAENNVIGAGGSMPWHIKEELAHFKSTTMGRPVIMGRKTFESFSRKKPLKGRLNIILSKKGNLDYDFENVKVASSLEKAYQLCFADYDKVFIIGGADIYKQAINDADTMILSFIPVEPEGDTYFPLIKEENWRVEKEENFEKFKVKYYTRINKE